jgi:hypothetical protein
LKPSNRLNEAQWIELQEKGATILRMFRDRMPALAPMLDGVEFVRPDLRYTGSLNLDLGDGHIVELHEFGGAHSRGDQAITGRMSPPVGSNAPGVALTRPTKVPMSAPTRVRLSRTPTRCRSSSPAKSPV